MPPTHFPISREFQSIQQRAQKLHAPVWLIVVSELIDLTDIQSVRHQISGHLVGLLRRSGVLKGARVRRSCDIDRIPADFRERKIKRLDKIVNDLARRGALVIDEIELPISRIGDVMVDINDHLG